MAPKNTKVAKKKLMQLPNRKKPNKRKNNNPASKPSKSSGFAANNFSLALSDPFNPRAIGVHVPDPYPFPTTTYHVHQTTVLKSPASGTGSGGVMLLPNASFSMIDCSYAGTLVAANAVVLTTPMAPIGNNPFNYGAVGLDEVFSKFGAFRVVGWGIKISNLQPELSATGRIIVAHLPVGDSVPSLNVMNSTPLATSVSWLTPVVGIRPDIIASSALIEMPDAVEFAVQDLLHGDIQINGRYTNSTFWDFKSAARTGGPGGDTEGDDIYYSVALGTVQKAGFKDLTRSKGGAAIAVYFEGMPVTSGTTLFQIETIYHLEGSPTLGNTTNTSLIAASSGSASVGTTTDVERAMIKASMPEMAYKFISKGAQFLNNNRGLISAVASTFI